MQLPMNMNSYVWIYLILINVISFISVGWDKRKAKKRRWRIPEKRLFILAIAGGALGVYFGMQHFRHKTQHRKFTVGIPVLIILNIVVFYYLVLYGINKLV